MLIADYFHRPDWQRYGACHGIDPALFFPERGASTREAKAVCAGCVVREDCLAYALDIGEKHGIWGGMSERERRRMRGARSRSALCAECCTPFQTTNFRQLTCSTVCADGRHRRQQEESRLRRRAS